MDEQNYESTNIHLKWLENIYDQLKMLQDFERVAREGCGNLMEYLQVPIHMRQLTLAEAQYKNLRYMILEMDILITNLLPVLKRDGKDKEYRERIQFAVKTINHRTLFLKEVSHHGQIVRIDPLPFLDKTIDYVSAIKSDLIKDIGDILYLNEKEGKSW